jgi:predicted nucleic acid-binding protein
VITLLDANFLIALMVEDHPHHHAALRFFPELPAAKHLTDIYLLGLAVKRGGRFATFDSKIDASVLPGGIGAYYIIPT